MGRSQAIEQDTKNNWRQGDGEKRCYPGGEMLFGLREGRQGVVGAQQQLVLYSNGGTQLMQK